MFTGNHLKRESISNLRRGKRDSVNVLHFDFYLTRAQFAESKSLHVDDVDFSLASSVALWTVPQMPSYFLSLGVLFFFISPRLRFMTKYPTHETNYIPISLSHYFNDHNYNLEYTKSIAG